MMSLMFGIERMKHSFRVLIFCVPFPRVYTLSYYKVPLSGDILQSMRSGS